MQTATIIYYSSNREDPHFESRIQTRLVEHAQGLPIISVTHTPSTLGTNICLGSMIPSNVTLYRQLLAGAEAATTPFVINAEADFLYPPEYFTFRPPEHDLIYRYTPIRLIMQYHDWGAFPKDYSEGAQIVGREYLIGLLRRALANIPTHLDEESLRTWSRKMSPYRKVPYAVYGSETPALTFKTNHGLHRFSTLNRGSARDMPLWGNVRDIREAMFGGRGKDETSKEESTDENS